LLAALWLAVLLLTVLLLTVLDNSSEGTIIGAASKYALCPRPSQQEEEVMALANVSFKSQRAPCGQIVDGESYRDQDEEVLITEELDYACGCRSIRHEYHDGSVSSKVVRHDGTVLVDELLFAE
jgi:hypothetical protein